MADQKNTPQKNYKYFEYVTNKQEVFENIRSEIMRA